MRSSSFFSMFVGMVMLLGLGCTRTDAPPSAEATHPAVNSATSARPTEPEHEGLPTRIRLDPSVVAAAKIKTLAVSRESLSASLELSGEIISDPDKTARVAAVVPGRIESVNFKEGQLVKKGDVLVVIKVPELGKTKAAFAATTAKAVAARTNAERLHALAEKRLAANQEVVAAQAEAEALEAESRAAGEQLRALGAGTAGGVTGSQLAVRAQVTGLVVARDAIVGQPVATDQILATIADLDEVWFVCHVFEKNLSQLKLGAAAEIQLNAYPKERFLGNVEYLGKQVDPAARTITARIRLTNRDELLRLGLFGVARVSTGQVNPAEKALVLPRSAIVEIGDHPVVFVREANGDFLVHQVVLGESVLGKVQVMNGLREGEQVVVEGTFTLKSSVLKSSFGSE